MTETRQDTRSTCEIVAAALACDQSSDVGETAYWNCVSELWERGGQLEFDVAKSLFAETTEQARELGANILIKLGKSQGKQSSFSEQTIDYVTPLLKEASDEVRIAATHAVANQSSPRTVPLLLTVIDDPNFWVRYAVVLGLTGELDSRATDGLVKLCHDTDDFIRDWASFGLCTECEAHPDSPELRAALHGLLSDPNKDIRGQALLGLAKRGDQTCLEALRAELNGAYVEGWGEFDETLAIEAAGLVADASLTVDLNACRARMIEQGLEEIDLGDIDCAITACLTSTPVSDVK